VIGLHDQRYVQVAVSMLLGSSELKGTHTGAVDIFVLNSLKACCSFSPHSHLLMHSFFVRGNTGSAVLLKPSINRR